MGAFFLFNSTESLDLKAAHRAFYNKGFSKPNHFNLNNLTLWLYKKQLVNDNNYVFSTSGSALFATGTLVYKGKTHKNSLTTLLEDFESDRVFYKDIIGSFCVIFFKNKNIYILTDRSNMYRIFTNNHQSILSSSFLALISAQKKKYLLNKSALLENLLMGYIAGPETLLKDIFLLNNHTNNTINPSFSFLSWPEVYSGETYLSHDFKDCVSKQLKILSNYYKSIIPLASQYGVDLGLSGGYDSRLNLLLTDILPAKVTAHTHFSAEHYNEKRIAEMISKEKGIPLRVLQLSTPEKMSEEELIENLSDSLNFFDGCANETMGTFNDVHTKKYRIAALGQNRLGLNGLGGELYRNHDYTYYNKLNFVEWTKYHVMDPYTVSCLENKSDLKFLIDHVTAKYIKILGIKNIKYIDKHTARRYYAEIWLPYSCGIKSHAENQLAFFLMPFTEYHITLEALKATPHIGITGKFEASMIMKLDRKIGGIPSSYGFGFDRESLSYQFNSFMRCCIPDRIKNTLGSWKIRILKNNSIDYTGLFTRHNIIPEIIDTLIGVNLPINLNRLFAHRSHFARAIFIGYFLHRFSNKISL